MANVDQIINKITQGNMESLNLSNKNIGNEGVIKLAKALEENQTITTLDLRDNNIGDEGVIKIYPTKASSSSLFLHILNEKGKVEKTQQFFNPRQLDQKIKQLQQKGYKKI